MPAARPPCCSRAPAPRRSPAPRPRPAATCPSSSSTSRSGTLTLAGTLRTGNNWTYTAGALDPASSTLVFAGGTITGSQTPQRGRAPGDDLDRGGHDPDRRPARPRSPRAASTAPGTLAAQGDDQPGLDCGRRDGHPAHHRHRRPDLHRRRPRRPPATCPPIVINKPSRHAHPGGHDPHQPQLDVHRGHASTRAARRSSSRAARSPAPLTLTRARAPGDDLDRRGHDADRDRHDDAHRGQPQRHRARSPPRPT